MSKLTGLPSLLPSFFFLLSFYLLIQFFDVQYVKPLNWVRAPQEKLGPGKGRGPRCESSVLEAEEGGMEGRKAQPCGMPPTGHSVTPDVSVQFNVYLRPKEIPNNFVY